MSAAAAGHEMMDGRPSAGNREIKGDEDRRRLSVVTRHKMNSLAAFFNAESERRKMNVRSIWSTSSTRLAIHLRLAKRAAKG